MAVEPRPTSAAACPSRKRILIVDDEPLTADVIARYLDEGGYETAIERNGHAALTRAAAWQPDLLVLDVRLPRLNGLEVLRRLTAGNGRRVAVILLSAIAQEEVRIRGLALGADDYVAKPFSARELVARVAAVLRRSSPGDMGTAARLVFDGLEIDPATREATIDGRCVALTPREFDLLLFMASRPGQVFPREQLMDEVWRFPYYSDTTTVTVHIRRLRSKIEPDPSKPTRVETVWGAGYRFRP